MIIHSNKIDRVNFNFMLILKSYRLWQDCLWLWELPFFIFAKVIVTMDTDYIYKL